MNTTPSNPRCVFLVLGMLAAGDDADTILAGHDWLEREDILACLAYAHRRVSRQPVDLTCATGGSPASAEDH